uniref:Uncharacterized protein n=1 Tax=Arundo donax TaxID=35708 RepID=A0A0A9AMC5_ARUDO
MTYIQATYVPCSQMGVLNLFQEVPVT